MRRKLLPRIARITMPEYRRPSTTTTYQGTDKLNMFVYTTVHHLPGYRRPSTTTTYQGTDKLNMFVNTTVLHVPGYRRYSTPTTYQGTDTLNIPVFSTDKLLDRKHVDIF